MAIACQLIAARVPVDHAGSGKITPLYAACSNGHADVAKLLLQSRASPNQKVAGGGSALLGACRHDHAQLVALLLKAGADVNQTQSRCKGALLATPLSVAARHGHAMTCMALLDARASLWHSDCENPVAVASAEGHHAVAELLQSHRTGGRANADAKCDAGVGGFAPDAPSSPEAAPHPMGQSPVSVTSSWRSRLVSRGGKT